MAVNDLEKRGNIIPFVQRMVRWSTSATVGETGLIQILAAQNRSIRVWIRNNHAVNSLTFRVIPLASLSTMDTEEVSDSAVTTVDPGNDGAQSVFRAGTAAVIGGTAAQLPLYFAQTPAAATGFSFRGIHDLIVPSGFAVELGNGVVGANVAGTGQALWHEIGP